MDFNTPRNPTVVSPEQAAGLHRQAETTHLGDAIAELASRIQAATYQLLVLIHEFDEREGWGEGFMSCAHWLNWRTGLAMGAAREKVRVARALAELPRLSAAMRRGALSYSKARALTRIATPENENSLADFARCATAALVHCRLTYEWRTTFLSSNYPLNNLRKYQINTSNKSSQHQCGYDDDDCGTHQFLTCRPNNFLKLLFGLGKKVKYLISHSSNLPFNLLF